LEEEIKHNIKSHFDKQKEWIDYKQKSFNRCNFIEAGKEGWNDYEDSIEREIAREPINRLINIEIRGLYEQDYTHIITSSVYDTISKVSRGLIRRRVRNHIKSELHNLIYDV